MLHRKRRILFLACLIGGLSLGAPGAGRADEAHRAVQQATASPLRGGLLCVQPTSFTPYDRYLGVVRAVINHLEPHPASMSLACRLMQEGWRFHYVMGDPYAANPPDVTVRERAGDCKSKALWLYSELGDANALYVIGKATWHSRTSHAWVYWRNENRWWILDCTNRSMPVPADSVAQGHYIPYYSYGRSGTYRHQATYLLTNPAPAVADRGRK